MNKKKTVLSIIIGLLLAIVVIGISYAYYNYQFIGNSNILSSADISLEFLESNSNIITIENALPMGCDEGAHQEETFDFAVTSKTKRDVQIKYNLYIEKLEVDNDATALNDSDIALYLTDYSEEEMLLPHAYDCPKTSLSSDDNITFGQSNPVDKYKNIKPTLLYLAPSGKISRGGISLISQLDNYKLYSNIHAHDSDHEVIQDKFKLRAWIAPDNVNAFNWNSSTKYQYKFKIGLKSDEYQTPSVVYNLMSGYTKNGEKLNSKTEKRYCIIGLLDKKSFNSCDYNEPFISAEECENFIEQSSQAAELENPSCVESNVKSTLAKELSYTTRNGYCMHAQFPGLNGQYIDENECDYGSGYSTLEECESGFDSLPSNAKNPSCSAGSWNVYGLPGYSSNALDVVMSNKTNGYIKHNLNNNGAVQSSEACIYTGGTDSICLKPGLSNYASNKQLLEDNYGVSNCEDTTTWDYDIKPVSAYGCKKTVYLLENGNIRLKVYDGDIYVTDSFSYVYISSASGGSAA